MSYIPITGNTKLFVQDWGSGQPLVFIAGWPFDHRCYEYQFNQLPNQGYRCIGIDMRGFGLSTKPWEGYSYDIFSDDINRILEVLNLKNAILIGHSMGGAICLRYATRHQGNRLSGLVLLGAAAPRWTQALDYQFGFSIEEVNKLIDLCYSDRPQLLKNFSELFFLTKNSVSTYFANWLQNIGLDASGHATAKCLEALRDTDLRAELSKINVPTLIMHSEYDRICPFDFAKELKKGIKNSTLTEFEKGGHGFFYEERDKFNKELVAFIKQIEPISRAA